MERFGRYRVTGTLGAGAMGEVHLAVDEVLGREVAIKTLKGGASGLAARLLDDRFRQEARAIAALAHPGVVQVFDIDLNADPPYLVMERVGGPSLKERLATRPLSDRELRALGIQIANALAAAHAAGIIHRDVKPANILAAGEGTWKLADFGVAHVPDSELTMSGQFVGSPAYAPPEALLRGQLGPAGDIYGLGATLYQAVAGRWPRADSTTSALFAPVPPLAQLAPHVSPQLADIIDRAVALEPDARPTASELAAGLARAASQPVAAAPATPAPAPGAATDFVASIPGAPGAQAMPTPAAGTAAAAHAIPTPAPGAPAARAIPTPAAAAHAIPTPAPGAATELVASTPGGFVAHAAWTPAAPAAAHVMSTPGPGTAAAPPGAATELVASTPGVPAVALPGAAPPRPRASWQKHAFLGATVLVIVLIAISRRSPGPPAAVPAAPQRPVTDEPPFADEPPPGLAPPQPMSPQTIQVARPPLRDRKAAKDWNKIVEKIQEGKLSEARRKLDDFERKHGDTPETRSLAEQLDGLRVPDDD